VEKLLIAFRDKDPDGNGKNDTIPWGGCNSFGWMWNGITGAFGFAETFNVSDGGKLYEWCVYPGYKDFLKLAAKWYKAGLVDKEFVSLSLQAAWQKVQNQLIGAATTQISYVDQDSAMARPPNTIVPDADAKKGAEGVILVPPVGPTGKQGSKAYGINPVGYPFLINKKVDDTKAAKILQILDWMRYDGDESFVWALSGKPGVHFDWQGEPWNSVPLARKAEQIPGDVTKAGNFPNSYPPSYTKDKIKFVWSAKLLNLYNTWMFAERGQALSIRPYRSDLFNETRYSELNAKYGATLGTIVNEFQLKAITGVLDVDAEWDAYVANWNKNGGAELMAEMAKAPILSELRKGKRVY
jgi:putative aldouronate transport system substrate-binding protein